MATLPVFDTLLKSYFTGSEGLGSRTTAYELADHTAVTKLTTVACRCGLYFLNKNVNPHYFHYYPLLIFKMEK